MPLAKKSARETAPRARHGSRIATRSRIVRVKTIQVALRDPIYADTLRGLLAHDQLRDIHLVANPDLCTPGVIIVDAAGLQDFPPLFQEPDRLIVVAHKNDDLSKIWEAGVRHVLFHGDPPETTNTVILGLELSLAAGGPA